MLKMANFRSSMDHQTHKGFDISKNFWCHTSVDLGEQPPEVWGDLDELFGILLLLLTIHIAIVAVCTDICDDQWGRCVADEKNGHDFQPTDVHSSFPLTDVLPSTSCRPSTNVCCPVDVLFRFPPTDDFSRLSPTDDLQRTSWRLLEKMRKKWTSLQEFSIFPPTDQFSKFPPTDDLQGTFRRLFNKRTKKYLS